MRFANEVCNSGLLMRFANEVWPPTSLATKFQLMRFWLFLTTVSHICTFYLVAGGQPPSRWERACQTSLVLMRFANEVMRFAKEDIGSCKEGRAT